MNDNKKAKFYFVQVLTLGRIPLIWTFLIINLLYVKQPMATAWFIAAFAAMILSAVTDLFDGYFARKFKVTSQFGAYADPLTDKFFYLTTLPTLVYLSSFSDQLRHTQLLLGMTILFLARDQWISFLRAIGALHGMDSKANWSGKARTIISFPVICLVYYHLRAPANWWLQFHPNIVYGAEIASIAINFISIWIYTVYYWPCLKKELFG